jgi:hypothetical protein
MGIFKKIFDWTGHGAVPDIGKNRQTVSRQPVEQNSPLRKVTETLPAPVVSEPDLTALDSSVSEFVPYPVVNSYKFEEPIRKQEQDPFASSPEWKKERSDRLQSTELDTLRSPDDEFLDQVVDAFDEAFDTACRSAMPTHSNSCAGPVQNDIDEAAVQDLFAQIAANYSQPLRSFVFELRCGTASRDRIEFLRSSLQMIGDAAAKMDLAHAVKRITDFDEVLLLAQETTQRLIDGEIRGLILDSYQGLIEVLPEIFRTGADEQKREDIIIKSLLQQIPGIGRVTFDKLYRAGLGSLHALFLANKEDLAVATSIPAPLCERIADKFQEYRAEALGISEHDPQSGYLARLTSLVAELRCRHEELENASAGAALNAGLATEKRRRRQVRQQCFLQIVATLAELGEVDLINKTQRLSFRQRLKRLEDHLETLDGEARSAPIHSAELVSQR